MKISLTSLAALAVLPLCPQPEVYDALPGSVMAFTEPASVSPRFRAENFEIVTALRFRSWAVSQGYSTAEDSGAGGYKTGQTLLLYAPGARIDLYAPVDDLGDIRRTGLSLWVDVPVLQPRSRPAILSDDYRESSRVFRAVIVVDGITEHSIEMGAGQVPGSLIRIPLPFIRDPEGRVRIHVRIAHHPDAFFPFYDFILR